MSDCSDGENLDVWYNLYVSTRNRGLPNDLLGIALSVNRRYWRREKERRIRILGGLR